MAAFQFETQLADLQNKYNQDNAAQEYGRFISQQRFGRQFDDMNRNYMRAFPGFTGKWAGRLGSDVKSGVFNQDLGNYVNDYGRQMNQLTEDQASTMGNYQMQQAQRDAAYQRALLALNEQLAAERAAVSPFAAYQGVYS